MKNRNPYYITYYSKKFGNVFEGFSTMEKAVARKECLEAMNQIAVSLGHKSVTTDNKINRV